ncbi:polymorphic toxin-type HINT domain-containing protein [Nonomuraea purpurea]|uniref:Polymorphic toxin-type HINT domain-containing protein n=1 Tax=Nonomuraea purpurea TaxID=1849276 RepID=A0ABV8GTH8_9ACTN
MLTGPQRVLLLAGVGALVLALVAGLPAWVNPSSESGTSTAAKRNLKPFEQAVATLAKAPGLRYRDTAIAGITERDITVTASGSQFGTTGDGIEDHDEDVLRIGGKTFTRWQVDPAPDVDVKPGTKTPSEWAAGREDGSKLLTEVLDQRPSPPQLAAQLSKALKDLDGVPQADDPEQKSVTVSGKPARGIDTSAGRLLITRQKPYRVLRLEPYDVSELAKRFRNGEAPAEIPQVTAGPLVDSDSKGMDLTPIVGDAVTRMFDTLEKQAKQLNNASDRGITFTLDGSGDLNCGAGGCTANQRFTGEVTSGAKTRIADGKVTAIMSATFTIGGQPAGQCTSSRSTFPLSGSTVSGSLTCTSASAGPVYTSVAAKYRADAQAQSRASGGQTVRYSIPLRARTLIDARALATVEVKQLIDRVRRERDTANCAKPHSFPPGTQILLADGAQRAIEDIRVGDQVTATNPESGLTTARPVTNTITTENDENFTRLTLATGRGPATITATDNHPFWLIDAKRWTDAADIRIGDELRSPTGLSLQVTGVLDQQGRQRTHDLTVADTHTYYVLAGDAPVLVHNTGPCKIPTPSITERGLSHSFDRHAEQWFGRPVTKADKMGEWNSLIKRAAGSTKIVSWSSGSTLTNAYLARIDGKWFVAQFDRSSGELVTAFAPNNGQVGAMLKLLRK